MYSLKKEFKAEYSHRLMKHTGQCQNLHGHSARIIVEMFSEELDDNNMIIDFGELDALKLYIDNSFDHSMILNMDDPLYFLLKDNTYNMKIFGHPGEPTAEAFAKQIAEAVQKLYFTTLKLKKIIVTFYETEKNCATYTIDG